MGFWAVRAVELDTGLRAFCFFPLAKGLVLELGGPAAAGSAEPLPLAPAARGAAKPASGHVRYSIEPTSYTLRSWGLKDIAFKNSAVMAWPRRRWRIGALGDAARTCSASKSTVELTKL